MNAKKGDCMKEGVIAIAVPIAGKYQPPTISQHISLGGGGREGGRGAPRETTELEQCREQLVARTQSRAVKGFSLSLHPHSIAVCRLSLTPRVHDLNISRDSTTIFICPMSGNLRLYR